MTHRRHASSRHAAAGPEVAPLDPAPRAPLTRPHRKPHELSAGERLALRLCRAAGLPADLVDTLKQPTLDAAVAGTISERDLVMLLRSRQEQAARRRSP